MVADKIISYTRIIFFVLTQHYTDSYGFLLKQLVTRKK